MSLHRNDSKQKMKESAHQATLVEDQATRMHNRSLEQVNSGCCAKEETSDGEAAIVMLPLLGLLGVRRRRAR